MPETYESGHNAAGADDSRHVGADIQDVAVAASGDAELFLKNGHGYLPNSASKPAILAKRRRWRSAPENRAFT